MEEAVFDQFKNDFGLEAHGKDGFPIEFSDIRAFLKTWNSITEIGGIKDSPDKVVALETKLSLLLGWKVTIPTYEVVVAQGCRYQYLRDANLINAQGEPLSSAVYDSDTLLAGVILQTPTGNTKCSHP